MPPRIGHKKSRNGCDRCKQRRVKCNEEGPPCANCRARGLDCTYHRFQRKSSPHPSPNPHHSHSHSHSQQHNGVVAPVAQSSSSPPSPGASFSLQDLELMHKFSTETYRSLCNDPSDHHDWQTLIPRKALECHFLLCGVLAVGSLHTAATIAPAESLKYVDTTLQYHNRAYAPFQHALGHLSPENCDAILGHAIITTVINMALPQLMPKNAGSSMTENTVVIFELLQGVKQIFKISSSWRQAKLFTPRGKASDPVTLRLDPETEAAFARLHLLNDKKVAEVDVEEHKTNQEAIHLLRSCFLKHWELDEPASVLAFISAVGKEFASYLRLRRPFPLLILMHWGVLLDRLERHFWWAKNSGKALVRELLDTPLPLELECQSACAWVKTTLSFG